MIDRILYFLFILIYYVIKFIPDKLRYYIGKTLGNIIYRLIKSRREITIKNLKNALGDRYSNEEIIALSRKTYQQLALTMVEFMLLPDLTKDDFSEKVDIEGLEHLEKAYQEGRGVIIYSAHFGNWEWLLSIISQLGYPCNAVARPQNNPYFDKKINEIRSSMNINIIPKGISVRQAFKVLRKGELLYILGDQNARSKGWQIDFFGRPTSVFSGVVQLASRTGALIVPAYLTRKKWGKHHLKFYSSYDIKKGSDKEEKQELLIRLNKNMERVITKYPEQWLWMHKRWKK